MTTSMHDALQQVQGRRHRRNQTWSRESDSECAGSVDTTSVWCPAAASLTASDAARLVFPTPPLPLIMMYLRAVPAENSSKALASAAFSSVAASAVARSSCRCHERLVSLWLLKLLSCAGSRCHACTPRCARRQRC